MPLPWRTKVVDLPNNEMYAYRRLISLKGRFIRMPELWKQYDAIIKTHLAKGYIERIQLGTGRQYQKVWYLPHHPVLNPRKTSKVRVVFDCAAKFAGTSLNDHLYPNLIPRTIWLESS